MLFDGALLQFGQQGKGVSKARVDSPADARITLEMTFLDEARSPVDTEARTLATLVGQVTLSRTGAAVFTGTGDEPPQGFVVDPTAGSQAPEGATSRRTLRFAFGKADFERVPHPPRALEVKLDPVRFRYLEVRAKLEIDGSIEADFDINDVLDIAITPANPPPVVEGVTVGIHPPLFDSIPPHAQLLITPSAGKPISFDLESGRDHGDGLLSFTVPDPQPGVRYKGEIRMQTSGPGTLLFKDLELHQLVLESEGASPAPLSSFGSDGIAFDSVAEDPPAGEAVQGGPEETTADQLAALDAQAGTAVLV
ncbi:MAG: hypothetical protein K0R38_2316 [Polyangiaceae bacterium]|nr:hypothetical protein [Polyangiaceae bacterium]